MKELDICMLCPRNCGAMRNKKHLGTCSCDDKLKIAHIQKYYFEEPPISGTNGSGAIFFSGCNLKCVFCQNHKISKENYGKEISVESLANIMLELESIKCHNINLVTPTMYIPFIRDAIILARKKGLSIPIIYNTSGYEKIESLKLLNGLIDIYLPDFKYYFNSNGVKYSKVKDYVEVVKEAIDEMYRQVGKNIFSNNILEKGIIVRHMILPGHIDESKKILKYLYDKYKDNIYISIMNQYTPINVENYPEINRKVSDDEYNEVINYAIDLGIKRAFIQEGETCSESFIPNWDIKTIKEIE